MGLSLAVIIGRITKSIFLGQLRDAEVEVCGNKSRNNNSPALPFCSEWRSGFTPPSWTYCSLWQFLERILTPSLLAS